MADAWGNAVLGSLGALVLSVTLLFALARHHIRVVGRKDDEISRINDQRVSDLRDVIEKFEVSIDKLDTSMNENTNLYNKLLESYRRGQSD